MKNQGRTDLGLPPAVIGRGDRYRRSSKGEVNVALEGRNIRGIIRFTEADR